MTMLTLGAWPLPDADTSTRLCLMLLHSLWQFGLLAVIVVCVARRWPQQSAQASYLTGVVAMLVGFLLLPVTYLAIDISSFADATSTAFPTLFSETAALPPAETVHEQSASGEVQPLVTNPVNGTFVASSAKTLSWRSLTPWLVGLYITGVAWMLLRLVMLTWQAQRLRRRASFIASGPLHACLHRLARRWRLQVVPRLAVAEQVAIPGVIGLLRPTILLPAAALTGLSRQELELILAHELAHVRRHDVWIHLAQRLAEAVLFFNPALWFLSRRISLYREYCCDEMACDLSNHRHLVDAATEPQTRYAMALLRVVELAQGQPSGSRVGSLAAEGRSPSELRRRIARLLGEPLPEPIRFTRGAAFTLLGICLLLASPVVWPSRAQSPQPQEQAKVVGEKPGPQIPVTPAVSETNSNLPATITGRIVMENGQPATTTGWMLYRCRLPNGNGMQGTDDQYTDHFSSKLPAGKIWLRYFPDGFAPTWAGPFDIKPGETRTDVTLVLKRGFSSLIQVRDQQGAPIANATLNALPEIHENTGGPMIDQLTDENGNLRLENLAETRYSFRITAPGFRPLRTKPLTLAPDKTLVQIMQRAQPAEDTTINSNAKLNARVDGDVNQSDRYRLTALARAAEQNNADRVRALLAAGANINQATDGYTALMRACIGKAPETAKILLEAGANPNLQRHDGQSALHFAAKNGSVECTQLLLRHDADVKAQTAYKNWTPRDWAQHYKHLAVVDLLDE